MNIKSYVFRLAITASAFLMGFSAHRGFQYVDAYFQSQRIEKAAAPVPRVVADTYLVAEVAGESPVDLQQSAAIVETNSDNYFNHTGEYYLEEENLPSGFKDFDYLEIETHTYDSKADSIDPWTPIPPKGAVHTKRGYKFKTVSVSPSFLVFETESKDGISYRFVGKFARPDEPDENYAGDITGKLTKLKNGVVIASTKISFYAGGC